MKVFDLGAVVLQSISMAVLISTVFDTQSFAMGKARVAFVENEAEWVSARKALFEAAQIDPAFRTPYHHGPFLYASGRNKFQKMLLVRENEKTESCRAFVLNGNGQVNSSAVSCKNAGALQEVLRVAKVSDVLDPITTTGKDLLTDLSKSEWSFSKKCRIRLDDAWEGCEAITQSLRFEFENNFDSIRMGSTAKMFKTKTFAMTSDSKMIPRQIISLTEKTNEQGVKRFKVWGGGVPHNWGQTWTHEMWGETEFRLHLAAINPKLAVAASVDVYPNSKICAGSQCQSLELFGELTQELSFDAMTFIYDPASPKKLVVELDHVNEFSPKVSYEFSRK
jgi:hypothetical protein